MPKLDTNERESEPKKGSAEKHDPAEAASVKLWNDRVTDAKKHWKDDFARMKENMEFAAGIQWKGQDSVDDKQNRYIANITQRNVNEKVASLYARNPRAEYNRRHRLDFQVWDGKVETLLQAFQAVQMQGMSGQPMSLPAMAVLQDYMKGKQREAIVDRVGKTLEIVYQWQLDEQEPDFKEQMKDLVATAVICGVAYVKIGFERDYLSSVDTYDTHSMMGDRLKRIEYLVKQFGKDKLTKESAQVQELRSLVASLDDSMQSGEAEDVSERLVFSFPSPTSIIVDPKATSLKNFKGARWIAEEHVLPLNEVNEFFETDITLSSTFVKYTPDGKPEEVKDEQSQDPMRTPMCCLWQVYDFRAKSEFFIVDGYKCFVSKPAPVNPDIRRFWPVFPLTFNNTIVTPGQKKVSIFPASDVQGMKSAQKEWNRSRQSLREHRTANAPKYVTGAQWLTEADRDKIESGVQNALIEIQGAPSGADMEKLIRPFPVAPINQTLYDTAPLQQDVLLVNGSQQANLGPLTGATATEATIGEQSKMSTSSSDVDNLNSVLTGLAKAAGEICLRELSLETVQRIAGPGAAWPTTDRESFINEIELTALAGSSGRPNQLQEQQKFERIVPLLLQAGANPQAIIREGVKRLDDNLEVEDFFPLPGLGAPQPMQPQQPQPQGSQRSPARKPQPAPQPGAISRPPQQAGP